MKTTDTKQKILTAARKLFVTHGFSGTSMGKVATLAGVNHSLIFHHFNNKEELWIAVKQNIVQESNAKYATLPSIDLPFNKFLTMLFENNIKFYRENPDLIRMINWQRLEHNENQKIGITNSTEMQKWIAAFKHYQDKGDIKNKTKPEFIITLVLSIISSAALDTNTFIADTINNKKYFKFCIDSLISAI